MIGHYTSSDVLDQIARDETEGELISLPALQGGKADDAEGADSLRAFRASVRNEEYVRDVAEQRAKREKEEAEAREKAKVNPFNVSGISENCLWYLGSCRYVGR